MLLLTFIIRRRIKQRQEAVAELTTNDNPSVSLLRESILYLPDLERMLCSAYHKKVRKHNKNYWMCTYHLILLSDIPNIHTYEVVFSVRILFSGQVS